jgi:integrase
MASFRKKGKIWYYRFTDSDGTKRERTGCPDRRATEEMARAAETGAAKIKAGLIDTATIRRQTEGRRLIGDHLGDWHRAMVAKGRTVKHADLSQNRATRVASLARATRLDDLQPAKIQHALAALKDEGLSLESVNHHRACIRAFIRWARADGRLRDDPMLGVTGYNAKEDVRHARRDLSDAELTQLIEGAYRGPESYGLSGTDRALAYRLALATGFRADEIRSLTPESFRLDAPYPRIVLRPADEKARRGVEQPCPAALADDLRRWLVGKAPGQPVLPLHHETAKMIRKDLEAVGIAYETEEGAFDFHALRGAFISRVERSGASVKTLQTLARHAKAETTLARYARASIMDVVGAVENLPDLGKRSPRAEPMAATGTDGPHAPGAANLAHYLPTGGDGAGRTLADSVGILDSTSGDTTGEGESQTIDTEGISRLVSATDANSAERGGFEKPISRNPIDRRDLQRNPIFRFDLTRTRPRSLSPVVWGCSASISVQIQHSPTATSAPLRRFSPMQAGRVGEVTDERPPRPALGPPIWPDPSRPDRLQN